MREKETYRKLYALVLDGSNLHQSRSVGLRAYLATQARLPITHRSCNAAML